MAWTDKDETKLQSMKDKRSKMEAPSNKYFENKMMNQGSQPSVEVEPMGEPQDVQNPSSKPEQKMDQNAYIANIINSMLGATQLPGMDKPIVEEQSFGGQALHGIGSGLAEMPIAAYSSLTGSDFQPVRSGSGPAFESFKTGTMMAPYFIPALGATKAARMVTAGAGGYLMNPEDPMGGLLESLAISSGLEFAGPLLGKGAEAISDKFTRSNYMEKMAESIRNTYKEEKNAAYGIVKPLFDKFGNTTQIAPKLKTKVNDMIADKKDFLSENADLLLSEFNKNPTLNNLQNLKSQISSDSRGLDLRQAANRKTKDVRSGWNKNLNTAIQDSLETLQKGGAEKYKEFNKAYAIGPGKYEGSKTMKDVIDNKMARMSPKKLQTGVQEAVEAGAKEGHYLEKILPELQGKNARSGLYQSIAAALAGGAIGGPGGALLGAATPKLLSTFMPSSAASQKEISRIIEAMYPSIKKGAIGYKNTPQPITVETFGEFK